MSKAPVVWLSSTSYSDCTWISASPNRVVSENYGFDLQIFPVGFYARMQRLTGLLNTTRENGLQTLALV